MGGLSGADQPQLNYVLDDRGLHVAVPFDEDSLTPEEREFAELVERIAEKIESGHHPA